MSQKTNPTSLRLQKTNKHFSSSWYSDLFYGQTVVRDVQIRSYIEEVSEQIGHSQIFSYVANCYRRSYVYLFFLDARGIRSERERALRLPPRGKRRAALTATSATFLSSHLHSCQREWFGGDACRQNNASCFSLREKPKIKDRENGLYVLSTLNKGSKLVTSQGRKDELSSSKLGKAILHDLSGRKRTALSFQQISTKKDLIRLPLVHHDKRRAFPLFSVQKDLLKTTLFRAAVEETLDSHLHTYLSVSPIRMVQDPQSAGFLVQEIASIVQKGIPFKQIQDKVLSECTKNELIKGIRLSCSGRVGGRSKKAQKAKTQSVQWGETSLHVFSSKLSFASTSTNTPFGKVGIKVWLCFTK